MRFLGWMEASGERKEGPEFPLSSFSTPPPDAAAALLGMAERRLSLAAAVPLAGASEQLWAWNARRGASVDVRSRWEAVVSGRGLAVVAGQQPALLGGPLYTLYKLLTAVELARWLERETSVPSLAVFWVVGDDSDFGEVSAAWVPSREGRLVKLRDAAQPPRGALVGRLSAARQRAIWEAERALFAEHPRGAGLLEEMTGMAGDGETWAGFQAALLFRLAPDVPFVVLDGGHDAVLHASREWLEEMGGRALEERLREGEEDARRAGYDPALDPELGRRALYEIADDTRVARPGEEGSGPTPPRREGRSSPPGDPAAGRSSPPGDPRSLLAPNVVLRPLLQDACLPNVATICGPSELRYRSQLGPVYREAGVPEPARLPRLQATLVPVLARLGQRDAGYFEATRDPDGFLAAALREALPTDLLAEVDRVRGRLREDFDTLRGGLARLDSSLTQLAESASGKADYQLQRIEEGIEAKTRHRLYQKEPALLHWKEFVKPRDGGQERSLSLVTPYLSETGVAEVLLRAARSHVERMLRQGLSSVEALFLLERFTLEPRASKEEP